MNNCCKWLTPVYQYSCHLVATWTWIRNHLKQHTLLSATTVLHMRVSICYLNDLVWVRHGEGANAFNN